MTKDQARNFVNYVATREGVSLNFNSLELSEEELNRKATIRQEHTIDGLLREVPAAKDTFEYEDYKNNPTIGNASELIARAAEMGFGETQTGKTVGIDEAKNYVEYVAKRPGAVREGAHGLFSSTPNLDLDKIADEVAAYQGRIWRNVISIRREDADKLGYDTQKPWKEAVQQQIDTIAKNFHIPPEHLCWYAGMHNTGHHPHIHLFVYSTNPKEGHLNETGIKNIKRGFSKVIFADERLHLYEQKDEAREKLKSQVDELLSHLDLSGSQFPDHQAEKIYQNLLQLGSAVQNQPGRHFYKYLSKDLKQQTDQLLTELASAPDIKKLYALYCEQQQSLERMYVNEPSELPISENKELYFLKNKVIQHAEKLAGAVIGVDPANETSKTSDSDPSGKKQNDIPAENELFETILPSSEPTDEENINSLWKNVPPEPESNEPDEESEGPYLEALPEEPEPSPQDDISSMSVFELQEKAIGLNGNASARYELAKRFFYGQGVDRDYEKARMWFGLAADSGHTLAKYQLGKMYLYGIGIEKDLNLGKEYCLDVFYDITNELQQKTGASFHDDLCFPGTETDHSHYAYLEYLVGRMELAGEGVKQNDQNAFLWFRASALHGHVHSEYLLAKMYYDGRGTVQDREEALRLYQDAADQEDKYACYAAGRMLLRGIGAPEDANAAASYFMKASKQNVPYADFALARLCESGTGVSKDETAARALYKKALDEFIDQEQDQPDGFTEYRIAEMYLLGRGTQVDSAKAEEWFQKAVEFGNPQAAYELAGLYAAGTGVGINTDKANDLYQIALKGFLDSEQENPNAGQEYKIAGMYEKGLGTEIKIQEALRWYETAADHGHGYAQYQYSSLCKETNPLAANRYFHMALQTFLKEERESADTQREYKIAKMLLQLRDSSAMPQRFNYEQAAAQWLEKAANDGNAFAAFEAARLLEQKPYSSSDAETICFYYQLALTGFCDLFSDKTTASDTRARLASKIARMYLKGNGTVVREDEAFRWFSKAAELGDLSAQYQIGKMLLDGTGCDMDGNEAFRIFIDAAIRGNVFAQYQIGKMYEAGIGTAKDSFQSEYWFRTAAANGNEAAQNHLNYLEHQKDYDAQTIVGSFLRMLGSGINDRIEDSTTHRFGPDRKAMKKRRQQKAALGQKEDELDEVM
ncbi:MobP3 family relaxase [Caproicibacter fermentans]|uniref:SEL1-like repeat protein n=1 Tax=Caproicibacter fermentans TaxID=2576756 RepID=A0A7G8TD78_9FIRM|nr:MobP3 family relaxase [Caproicibacter fermentans]QNK41569.1 SEL1-like repeat protein [Caproicibacter fermentans]